MSIQIDRIERIQSPDSDDDDAEGLPAPEDVSPFQTAVRSLRGGAKQRKNAIRIRLPRDPQARADLPNDIAGVLVWIIADVCGESCIESLEILIYPAKYGLEFVLHPRPYGLNENSNTQSTLDSAEKKTYTQALSKLKQSVKRRYPAAVTAEVGHLDLEPVGISDVTTTRLYSHEDGNRETPGNSKTKPLKALFDAFRENHDPFIYQVIVGGKDGQYNASVRCATYRPKDTYTGDRDFARLVEQGKPSDLSRVFAPGNFTSNHDPRLAAGLWKTSYTKRVNGPDKCRVEYSDERTNQYTSRREVRDLADRNREIILGKREHRRLMSGDTSAEHFLKEDYNLYGWFSMFEAQLGPFVQTVTDRWETNPWLDVEGRSEPAFHSVEPIIIETDAEFGYGKGATDEASGEPDVQNEGNLPHRSYENTVERTFTEGGDDIEKVEQTTDSLPDLRIWTDDQFILTLGIAVGSTIVAFEVEDENSTKPSNTLKNAERAIAAGRHVIFAFTQDQVERGYQNLSRGYKKKTPDGNAAILYNQTDPVRTVDGRSFVRRGSGATTYELRGRELTASDDHGELVRGDASEDVSTFDWPIAGESTDEDGDSTGRCGYYRKTEDGTHRVETRDGTAIITYSEKKAFLADWCWIYEPHIPMGFGYLDHVTVTYLDEETNQIEVYDPTPEWATYERTETQKAGFAAFFERFIVARDGPQLTYDALDETFSTWFEGHSQYEAPVRSVIGGYLPDAFKDAKTGGTANKYQYFDGYDWLFDPTIDSPHQTGPPADYDPDDPEDASEPDGDAGEDGDNVGEDNDDAAETDSDDDAGEDVEDPDDAVEDDKDLDDVVEDDGDDTGGEDSDDDAEEGGDDDAGEDDEDPDDAGEDSDDDAGDDDDDDAGEDVEDPDDAGEDGEDPDDTAEDDEDPDDAGEDDEDPDDTAEDDDDDAGDGSDDFDGTAERADESDNAEAGDAPSDSDAPEAEPDELDDTAENAPNDSDATEAEPEELDDTTENTSSEDTSSTDTKDTTSVQKTLTGATEGSDDDEATDTTPDAVEESPNSDKRTDDA
ncbi:hypothetical protein PN419_17035 [Halorubrum ezzemoulense]|uniref:hypothetical protein n=1 Tax=Halorubrum ezzemoulense TaxID=337243 RepID=UPI00232B71A2|nr:hypothetical protein [Halorubrum ezzemoulense]MDB9250684.1 hypothetical protein [Halorubrum ezzemoulense]MDB9252972.1 hypothetical protein [Halorubrum ezzemoulense]MDB9256643.1 hypothetical protein [Halorubrum ezzemoulense]MDB9260780.1 hypothetical protein [Halorubrum ezzemoulense]MDB9264232.1 hypothetical protein [Halorubrum ezzemoulense]